MANPILFIETPRAGRHNHRFIAPDNYNGGDRILSQWADCARQQSEGANYLSVGKKVKQQKGGRTGTEQLILTGVDTSKLSGKQIENVRNFLTEYLQTKVNSLITEDIDWDKDTNIIVRRVELMQWLQELEQRLGKVPGRIGVNSKVIWAVGVGLVLVLLTVIFIVSCSDNNEGKPRNSKPESTEATKQAEKAKDTADAKLTEEPKQQVDARKERLVVAIGGDDKAKVREEIILRVIPTIPTEGEPWPLSMFVSNADDIGGKDFTGILSDKPLAKLQITYSKDGGEIQRLVQCRNAIRTLMGVAGEVYTPFFESKDFGNEATPTALIAKIYNWQSNDGKVNGQADGNCDTKPKLSGLMQWVTKCLATKYVGKYENDANLKRIKQFDMDCKAVFLTPEEY